MVFKAILIPFFISAFGSFVVSKIGQKVALIDNPNERSSHSLPTPRGGGVGIWVSFMLVGIFFVKDIFFTIAIGIVGLIGFLEDIFNIPSKLRLFIQFVISTLAVWLISGFSGSMLGLAIFLSWIVFIAGTANFYNFMDGINGIAGLTGIVAFGLVAYFSFYIADDNNITTLSIALMSACFGFLPFNFPKAKVFMGDVGSVFLGFVFGSFVVKLSSDLDIFLCLVMFLCTFYADAIITIYYRWKNGENLMQAHRSHLYQYMSNELQLPHWKVSIGYAVVQLIFGLLAIWAYNKNIIWQTLIIVIFGVLFIIIYDKVEKCNFSKKLR